MMRQIIKISILISLLPFCTLNAKSQFIQEILEYKPAPGQFINLNSTGTPGAAASIAGAQGGLVSLGAAGGYIVFRFSSPVINHPEHPYGIDFTLFGNPLPEWSEPGVVWVMKDEDHNGLPDDNWFQLAGSDHFFSGTILNNRVVYKEPSVPNANIEWSDNTGCSGLIIQNTFHTQSYYPGEDFQSEFYADSCIFEGTLLKGKLQTMPETGSKSFKRYFGYADNRPLGNLSSDLPDNPYTLETEGYGGDAFDLSWAYQEDAGYVDLDTVHFIKVQTSMYGIPGEVGEISTEILRGRLSPKHHIDEWENKVLIAEDIDHELPSGEYNLHAFFFENGRYQPEENISWLSVGEGIPVNEKGNLLVTQETDLEIYAIARDGNVRSATFRVKFMEPSGKDEEIKTSDLKLSVAPNPASSFIIPRFEGVFDAVIQNASGIEVLKLSSCTSGDLIDISRLTTGIYFLTARSTNVCQTCSFIKH